MGKLEDEFKREQLARQQPALLRGDGAPPAVPGANGQPPRAALLSQPLPSPGDRLRSMPTANAGLQDTIGARSPAVAAGDAGRAMESAAYREALPQSRNAGLAATVAERAGPAVPPPVPMTAQADAMTPMQRGAPDPGVRARLMQTPPPGSGLVQPPDPGVRARLTQAPPPGAGLGQTIASRAAQAAAAQSAIADPVTVAPNRTPSAPAKNPIVNPNTAGGLLSEDAAAYQASRAGAKIPDQVGVNKNAITGLDANGKPIPNTGARPTVPNMPPSVNPERAGMIARLRQAAGLGGAAPGGAGVPPGAAPGVGAAGAAGGAGAPPPPPAAPPAGAAGAAGPAGQPGGIRGAAQSAFGSGQQWREFGGKVAAKAAPILTKAAPFLKAAPVVGGGIELGNGLLEGDAKKAGWGAADTTAGAALYTPAAPVAGVYLAGRGGWEAGKWAGEKLPETTRDNIGSGINQLVRGTGQIFGKEWGVDERLANQYAEQQKAGTIAQAGRAAGAATSPVAAPAAAARKAPPAAAPAAGPVAAAAAVAPAVAAPAPRAAVQQQGPSPLIARYRELQAAQDASPIAFTTMGGGQGGMQVHFKDGTVSSVAAGGEMPQELADFNDRYKEMGAISAGRASTPPAAPAAAPAQEDWHPNRKTLHAAAVNQGYDPARAMMISAIETGGKFDAAAQNPKSSAFGLVQMTKANRDSYGLSEAEWKDPAVQARTGIDFMKKTDAGLASQLGRAPSPAESYMGHLFGVSGAATVLAADPNASLLDVVKMYDPKRANAIVNDNGMKGLTTGQAIAKWTALADRYMQQLGVASAAAPAQGGLTLAEMQEIGDGPIQMIRGLEKTMLAPNGNGYNEVPQTVYDAARMQGNVKAGVGNYLDNVNQGWNNYNNPKAAKLEEQALQNAGALNVANTTGGYHLAGSQLAAEAQKSIAGMNIEAGRGAITVVPGGETIDPRTGMSIKAPSRAVYVKDGVPTDVPARQGAAQAQPLPAGVTPNDVRNNSILIAKREPTKLAEINANLQKYGLPALTAADLN